MRAIPGAMRVARVARVALVAVVLLAVPAAAQPGKTAAKPVATRALVRNYVLTADDIALADSTGTSRAALDALRSTLVGSVTRRVIAAGEVLREPAVTAPNAIQAGQKVAVVWRDAGVEVRLAGTATNGAPLGGRVSVHVDVRRRLEGVVIAPGLVQIR